MLVLNSGQQEGALLFPGSGQRAGLLEPFGGEGHRLHTVDDGLNDVWCQEGEADLQADLGSRDTLGLGEGSDGRDLSG